MFRFIGFRDNLQDRFGWAPTPLVVSTRENGNHSEVPIYSLYITIRRPAANPKGEVKCTHGSSFVSTFGCNYYMHTPSPNLPLMVFLF